jgi:hypothetical protein
MIKKSDNQAASKIIDQITKTQYQENIQGEELFLLKIKLTHTIGKYFLRFRLWFLII